MAKDRHDTITFVGNSAQQVTGSSYLIDFNGKKILLEAGGVQTNNLEKDYIENSKQFSFKPRDLDYVYCLHSHIDHIFLIPKLVKDGFQGEIIIPKGNTPIMKILLEDSCHIIGKDCEYLNKTRSKKYKPIYEKEDVDNAIARFVEFDFNKKHKLDNTVSFEFYPSQHIMNSAQIVLELTKGQGKTKRVFYSSDLGNVKFGDSLYTTKFRPLDKSVDICICETTYCSEERSAKYPKERERDLELLKSIITQFVIDNKSKVLIPVFANHRCQTMMTLVYNLFKDSKADFTVAVDSPMAIKVIKEYSKLLEGQEKIDYEELLAWNRFRFLDDYESSQACISDSSPKVIISASGMLSQGRASQHLSDIIEDNKACVLLCGYASPNTLAGMIKDPKNVELNIGGKTYKSRVQLASLKTMSSHMQYSDLLEYYTSMKCKEIYLVHGNSDRYTFAQTLQDEYSNNNKSTKVYIGVKDNVVKI
jgi:metallo-beta-lactamase family protein